MAYHKVQRQGIELKKKHGQNFLKEKTFIDRMINAVTMHADLGVIEIGCGEGILTESILQNPCRTLKVFEIDPEWASYVHDLYGHDKRLEMILGNVLDIDWSELKQEGKWTLLANLPYHVTFPILYKVYAHKDMFVQGVVMVQEEVAQKIVKTSGRDYGYTSLFFQYYFHFKLLDKISPGAFFPPPKVFSRLLYLEPKKELTVIPDQEGFWKFIKVAFHQPRRTLRNNLAASVYDFSKIDEETLQLRAQQMSMQDFLKIWDLLR